MIRSVLLFVAATFLLNSGVILAQDSSPKLAVLDRAGMDQLQNQSVTGQLSLLWLRSNPSLFDSDKSAWRSFVLMNNCDASERDYISVMHALNSEFDAPKIVDFYKPKKSSILNLTSDQFTVTMQFSPAGQSFNLGQYDVTAKAFPFVNLGGVKTPVSLTRLAPGDAHGGRCSNPFNVSYEVDFPAVELSEVHMDENAAKQFVNDELRSRVTFGERPRPIYVQIIVEVLPGVPKVLKAAVPNTNTAMRGLILGRAQGTQRPTVVFPGKVNKVTAIAIYDGHPLGVLYP